MTAPRQTPTESTSKTTTSCQLLRKTNEDGSITFIISKTVHTEETKNGVTNRQKKAEDIEVHNFLPALYNNMGLSDQTEFKKMTSFITQNPILLNATDKNNVSAFFILLLGQQGKEFLLNNLSLLDFVSEETLNSAVIKGHQEAHVSPVLLLVSTPLGLEILEKHHNLHEKISDTALNYWMRQKAHKDFPFCSSPLTYLVIDQHGRKLLEKYPHLIDKFGDALTLQSTHKTNSVHCPFIFLLNERNFLKKYPHALDNSSSEVINGGLFTCGNEKGARVITFLAGTEPGREILLASKKLRAKISFIGLCQICKEGNYEGHVALSLLSNTLAGKKILSLLLAESEVFSKEFTQFVSELSKTSGLYKSLNPLLKNAEEKITEAKNDSSTSGRTSPRLFQAGETGTGSAGSAGPAKSSAPSPRQGAGS